MTYAAPLSEFHFVLKELLGLPTILSNHTGNTDAGVINSILDEGDKLARELFAPLNQAGDQCPPKLVNGVVTLPKSVHDAYEQYAKAGWQALGHAASIGGHGLPKMVTSAFNESLHGANMALALCPLLTDGAIELIARAGSKEQQRIFLPPLLEGRWSGTMNLTEPQSGSDLSTIKTRALPMPDGSYRLHGEKIFISYGEHDLTENIIHMVLARTPDAPKGVRGISLFIVPKYLPDQQGGLGAKNDVWCASLEKKLGIHASPTAVMLYGADKGEVGEGAIGYRVGEENHGLKQMFIMMNASRYAVGLQGVAISEAATQRAHAYAHTRIQGAPAGAAHKKAPIIHHPDVQRMLGTAQALTQGARALAYYTARCMDLQQPQRAELLIPVVKGFCTEIAQEVTYLAMQIHGGMGYIEETGIAQLYRDARVLTIYEGTTAIQANDLLNRKIFLDKGQALLDLLADIDQTLIETKTPPSSLQTLFTNLKKAHQQCTELAHWLLRDGGSSHAFFNSVPFLMLVGVTTAGWLMLRSAQIAAHEISTGNTSSFYAHKLATCQYFGACVLPKAHAYSAAIHSSRCDSGLPLDYTATTH